jgi:pimeloyl-ACP methyl ester carboxylesterase
VIEPLGIGFSARPEKANYSLTAQADRVAQVIEHLGAQGAIVVGHSVGASMAFRLAYRRPDLVRAVLSLEGGPAEAVMTPGARAAMRFIPWVKWLGGMKLIRGRIRKGLIETSVDSTWVTDEVVEGYTAGAAVDIDRTLKSMLTMSGAKEPEKIKARLHEIRAPVLLLKGSGSKGGVPVAEVELLAATLPSFDVDTIAGSGLYIQEERPAAVVDGVRKLLR